MTVGLQGLSRFEVNTGGTTNVTWFLQEYAGPGRTQRIWLERIVPIAGATVANALQLWDDSGTKEQDSVQVTGVPVAATTFTLTDLWGVHSFVQNGGAARPGLPLTFTFRAAVAANEDVLIGATVNETAANMALAINASRLLGRISLDAWSVGDTVFVRNLMSRAMGAPIIVHANANLGVVAAVAAGTNGNLLYENSFATLEQIDVKSWYGRGLVVVTQAVTHLAGLDYFSAGFGLRGTAQGPQGVVM